MWSSHSVQSEIHSVRKRRVGPSPPTPSLNHHPHCQGPCIACTLVHEPIYFRNCCLSQSHRRAAISLVPRPLLPSLQVIQCHVISGLQTTVRDIKPIFFDLSSEWPGTHRLTSGKNHSFLSLQNMSSSISEFSKINIVCTIRSTVKVMQTIVSFIKYFLKKSFAKCLFFSKITYGLYRNKTFFKFTWNIYPFVSCSVAVYTSCCASW